MTYYCVYCKNCGYERSVHINKATILKHPLLGEEAKKVCEHFEPEDVAPYGVTSSDHNSILTGDGDA